MLNWWQKLVYVVLSAIFIAAIAIKIATYIKLLIM